MQVARILACTVSVLTLAACTTNKPLVNSNGIAAWDSKDRYDGNYVLFQTTHDVALAVAKKRAEQLKTTIRPTPALARPSGESPTDAQAKAYKQMDMDDREARATEDAAAREMLAAGFSLINSNCQDYFERGGRNQHRVNFGRDAFVVGAGLVTSAVGLNPRNQESLTGLPIITGGVYSGIDTYNENFLFAADNIDEVRTLTMKALTAHQKAWVAQLEGKALTYNDAMTVLIDDQAYCTGPKILLLVQSAIKKGEVVPVVAAAPVEPPPPAPLSDTAAKAIGQAMGLPGAASESQAAALFWLFRADSTESERKLIAEQLKPLNAANRPFDDKGGYTSGWANRTAVENALISLNDADKARMRAIIAEWRAAEEERVKAAALVKSDGKGKTPPAAESPVAPRFILRAPLAVPAPPSATMESVVVDVK